MPIRRLSGGTNTPCAVDVNTRSPTRTSPASGFSRPATSRSVVVLPQPLGPSNVTSEPAGTSKSIASTAGVLPKALERPVTQMFFMFHGRSPWRPHYPAVAVPSQGSRRAALALPWSPDRRAGVHEALRDEGVRCEVQMDVAH